MRYSILYVEDEEIIVKSFDKLLKRLKSDNLISEYFIAKDGKDALKIYNDEEIDIVITDIKMPNLDGIELSKIVRERDRNLSLIFSTAYNDFEYINQAIELGVKRFIPKPINYQFAKKVISDIIDELNLKQEILEQKNTLSQYKYAIDKSAIVSKTDSQGVITYVNDNFCSAFGYEKEELLGKKHNMLKPNENVKDTLYNELWSTILKKRVWRGIIKNITKTKDTIYTDTTITPILSSDRDILEFIAIRFDITEKELERINQNKKIIEEKSNLLKTKKRTEMDISLELSKLNDKFKDSESKVHKIEQENMILKKRQDKMEESYKYLIQKLVNIKAEMQNMQEDKR